MTNPWNSEKPYDYSTSWISSKTYCRIVNERYTGSKDKHWYTYSIEKYICVGNTVDQSILILGSNEGWMEIAIRQAGFQGKIVASDIADKALQRAAAKVKDLGFTNIEHIKADLNVDVFPEASFDFVIAEGVLHHIENINFCIDGIHRSLKPGGLLLGAEFIGAFRFQFPEMQVRWINAALAAIPAKYRPVDKDHDTNLPPSWEAVSRVHYVAPSVEAMIAYDPSEAVAGHLLIPSIERNFSPIEKKYAGGAIMMNLTGHFPFHQANVDAECDAWLEVIAHMERVLYEQNIVPSDLVYFAYRKSWR
jgi:ubiquinone/menaquinone biosynthesis C-methylase UbiE